MAVIDDATNYRAVIEHDAQSCDLEHDRRRQAFSLVAAQHRVPHVTSTPRARCLANHVFCCASALWRDCPTPTSAWPDHAENGCRSSGAEPQETPLQSSLRMHPACPTSITVRADPTVRPSSAPARSTAEFRQWHSTAMPRQTTLALDVAPSQRRAFRAPSLAAIHRSRASRDAMPGIPSSSAQDPADAPPACIGNTANSPQSRLPTAQCHSCRATQAEVAAPTNAERSVDDPANRKHPNRSSSMA